MSESSELFWVCSFMAGAVFGLSTFSFQSWADAFNPREPGWKARRHRSGQFRYASLPASVADLGSAEESFYRQSSTLPLGEEGRSKKERKEGR